MHGSFKLLYRQIGRKGIATLSPYSTNRALRVDGRGDGWNGRNKGSFSKQPNPGRDKHRRTYVIIHIGHTPVMSAVLIVEREEDGHKFPLQKPVYYVPLSSHHANPGTHITKK